MSKLYKCRKNFSKNKKYINKIILSQYQNKEKL